MIESKLGIGPMSKQVVKAVVETANEENCQLMLVASRNQIDSGYHGGGYVAGFDTRGFYDYVKSVDTNNRVMICRDHSGPYFSTFEHNLSPNEALESALKSIKTDIETGFDLIHIDCCMHKGNIEEATQYLLKESSRYARVLGKKLLFEVGSEENIGKGATPVKKFERDLRAILDVVQPSFIVGQTGSLTKEVYQVGYFDIEGTKKLTAIAHEYGVKFKEHNADYSDHYDLSLRSVAGVDAINVAPEFGYIQTKVTTTYGRRFGYDAEVNSFMKKSLESLKWKKWMYGSATDEQKALISGHYVFNTEEYGLLLSRLSRHIDIEREVINAIKTVIKKYIGGLR